MAPSRRYRKSLPEVSLWEIPESQLTLQRGAARLLTAGTECSEAGSNIRMHWWSESMVIDPLRRLKLFIQPCEL